MNVKFVDIYRENEMKCPECHKEGVRYINKEKDITTHGGKSPRPRFRKINNISKCIKCNWEGEL